MGDLHLSLAAAAEPTAVTSILNPAGEVGARLGQAAKEASTPGASQGVPQIWPAGSQGHGGGQGWVHRAILCSLWLQPEINLLG